MQNPLITFLELFKEIPLEDQQIIEAITEQREYKEGAFLLKEGSLAKELFFISNGILKIVAVNPKGNEVTYFFLKENRFCTILDSFKNKVAATESIRAACDTQVIVLPQGKLFEIFKLIPYLETLINSITQQALLDKIHTRNNYLGLDADARYRMFMMRQPEIALRVPMSDIASYLGITPQSLSRIRKNKQ